MQHWLDAGIILSAFVAAVLWFVSAHGKPPRMKFWWDGGVPDDDPFYMAIRFSAQMNRWAAVFSGLSALCTAVKAMFW